MHGADAMSRKQASPLVSQAFKPSAWLANIDFIKKLTQTSHFLIVVMSEAQGGKSTFVDLMRYKFEPDVQTILLQAEKDAPSSQLLESLSKLFDVKLSAKKPSFSSFFKKLPSPKRTHLLVVDHAECLAFEDLKALVSAYHAHGEEKKIHLCLVSDYSLSPSLQRLEKGELKNFIHTLEPGPLTESETKTFVMRYAQGHKGLSALMKPERFKAFYSATQGKIAAIHQHLDLLNQPAPTSTRFIKPSLKSLAACVVMIAAAIPFYFKAGVLHELLNTKPALVSVEPLESFLPAWNEGEISEVIHVSMLPAIAATLPLASQLPEIAALEFEQAPPQAISELEKPSYTLQFTAAKSRKAIDAFIKRHHLPASKMQVQQVLKGKERWYVLTMGGYTELTSAQNAAAKLPAPLKKVKPWIRSAAALENIG